MLKMEIELYETRLIEATNRMETQQKQKYEKKLRKLYQSQA